VNWNPVFWVSEARSFLGEVRSEFKKVTFPTRKEAMVGTVGVVVIVAIITVALGLVDFGLSQSLALVVD
jgi:preprotein translocase subunit SecE